jgi:hypothetical protein
MHAAYCPHAIEQNMRLPAANAVARILLLAARLSKEPDATPNNTGLAPGWNTTARA